MTRDEAMRLRLFKHHCTCGGYAHSINGRNEAQPHMTWCPQYAEYGEWYQALGADGYAEFMFNRFGGVRITKPKR